MSRVVITCSCGASIEASWTTDNYARRSDPTPPQIDQFRRDHRPCLKKVAAGGAADSKPKFGQGLPPAGGWKTRMTEQDLRDEMAAFIGHKGMGDEFTDWALAQRAEIDRLLAADSKDNDMNNERESLTVAEEMTRERQAEWFIREVKRCQEIGMPVGCCDEWPECSHVLAWVESRKQKDAS